jgi:hypothetical protein
MTAALYEYIGRFVVRLVWFRFGSQLKLAAAVFAGITALAGFVIARRTPPEG